MYLEEPSTAFYSQPNFYVGPSPAATGKWTREDTRRFELEFVRFPEDTPDRFRLIAERLGRPETEVLDHYEWMIHDVAQIEAGRIEVPVYLGEAAEEEDDDQECDEDGSTVGNSGSRISFGGKRPSEERKKGLPWSEEEHRLFLIGLHRFGKGDWRSISRHCVVSRTPTQVASHAQKFFLRQTAGKKDRRRTSIHDIKTVKMAPGNPTNPNMGPPPPQQPHMMQQMQPHNLANQDVPMDYQNFSYHM